MKRLTLASCVATLLVMPMLPTSVLASDDIGLSEQAPEPHETSAAGQGKASEARQGGKPPGHADNRGRPQHPDRPDRAGLAPGDGKPEQADQGNRPSHSYDKGRPEHSHQPGRTEHAPGDGNPGQPQQRGRP